MHIPMKSLLLSIIVTLACLLFSLPNTTSAQSSSSRPNDTDISHDINGMLNCMKCLSQAGLTQVPECNKLQDNPAISSVPIENLNEAQRQCYCGLVSTTEWAKSCSGPTLACNSTIVDTFLQGFTHIKPYVCQSSQSNGSEQRSWGSRNREWNEGRAVVLILSVVAGTMTALPLY